MDKKESLICFLKESCLKGAQLFPHGNNFPEPLGACGKQLLGQGLAIGVDTLVTLCSHHFVPKWTTFNPNFTLRSVTNRYKIFQEVREQKVWKIGGFQKVLLQKTSPGWVYADTDNRNQWSINLIPFSHYQNWTEFPEWAGTEVETSKEIVHSHITWILKKAPKPRRKWQD